jgi:hypothetical protein
MELVLYPESLRGLVTQCWMCSENKLEDPRSSEEGGASWLGLPGEDCCSGEGAVRAGRSKGWR